MTEFEMKMLLSTNDLSINRRNTTCRVRFRDGTYQAAMKSHSGNGDQSTETEMEEI